jgi:hypothetical protein
MQAHQRIGNIFWLMVGVYVAIKAYLLGLGHLRHPGAGFIFFVTAFLLIVLGVIDLAGSFIRKPEKEQISERHPLWAAFRWRKVLLIVGILSAYIYSFDFLGFFLSTFLLMVLLFKGVEFTKWWIAIVNSLITVLISYGIFKVWLKVPFPVGFLGF